MNHFDESTVQIAAFKSHLSQYLKTVRDGRSLVLLNRDTPVATVLPYPPETTRLPIRKPTRKIKDVRLPKPVHGDIDSLRVLMTGRKEGR